MNSHVHGLALLLCLGIAHAEPLRDTQGEPCPDHLPSRALNLVDVVNGALCHNPQTRTGWANAQVQAAQVGVLQAPYYPTVAGTAAFNRNFPANTPAVNQRSAGLTLSYLLYDFGARSANLENAQQLLIALQATENSVVQAVFLSAVQAFYQTQASRAALAAAEVSERAAQTSFLAAQARYVAGTATPADKLSAQTAWSQATLNVITAKGNYQNARGNLAAALGQDASVKLQLVETDNPLLDAGKSPEATHLFEHDVSALIEQARKNRPDLQAAAAQLKAADASVDAARAATMPTISVTANDSFQSVGGAPFAQTAGIGVSLSVPIFSGFAPTYRIRAAEATAESKKSQMQQLHLQVALDVWTAYQNLLTTTQTLRATQDLLQSATQSENVATGRYKAGMGIMLDVLNAQTALASARQQFIQAHFNWNIGRAALAQAVGVLDAPLLTTLTQTP
ncbi:MAG: TolC family protein [Gallionella sp.]|nr:TolC family protein [Gallionella sp.]